MRLSTLVIGVGAAVLHASPLQRAPTGRRLRGRFCATSAAPAPVPAAAGWKVVRDELWAGTKTERALKIALLPLVVPLVLAYLLAKTISLNAARTIVVPTARGLARASRWTLRKIDASRRLVVRVLESAAGAVLRGGQQALESVAGALTSFGVALREASLKVLVWSLDAVTPAALAFIRGVDRSLAVLATGFKAAKAYSSAPA